MNKRVVVIPDVVTRPKTTWWLRYVISLGGCFSFWPIGVLAWNTSGHNWLLMILLYILCWQSGKKMSRWAEKGRNGTQEMCLVCHHHVLHCECLPKEDDAPSA